jgi:serine/threonine protein kinase/Flp pilus assembly protein TadD
MTPVRPTPAAAPSADPAFDLLIDDLLARVQSGEAVDWSAVAREHPGHAERLRSMVPALAAIGDLSGASHPAARGSAADAAADDPVSGILGDYRILREVGRGGMGIVYEAEQISLGRRVALKVLPFAAALDAKQLQRFKNEAKAAASLKHDHIVSVYAVGCERAVHFYAMEYVEGQTLAQLIQARQAGGTPPAAAGAATLDYAPGAGAPTAPVAALSTRHSGPQGRNFYRTAAELVAQAADALEHAHSFGIVHRDVKPGNLLVDDAGRVYVSDFGLARFGPDAGLTASGDLLGTLRYMAPEQVLARHGLVDHRADVYALGATLYELLTGRPAVDAAERAEILRKIAFEDPTPPRKLDKMIPQELETITLKCLAKNPAERYATAGDLADDLRRWLEHKTIKAKPPSLRQRLDKWARRHRPAVGAGLVVLLFAAAALAGSAGWVARERAVRRAEAEAVVRAALSEAEQLQEQAQWPEALAAARRAEGLLAGGEVGLGLRRRVEETVAGLALVARLEEARVGEADAVQGDHFDFTVAARAYARAFREAGIDVDCLGPEAAAERIPAAVRVPVATALADWARANGRGAEGPGVEWLLAAARAADPDPWRTRLREATVRLDRPALIALAAAARVDDLPADSLANLGRALGATGAVEQAVAVLRRAQQRYPGDFWVNAYLALRLNSTRPPRPEEAIRFNTVAVALRPLSPGARLNLGFNLGKIGDRVGALAAIREAIRLKPDFAVAHSNLGNVLTEQGDLNGAIAAYREALRLKEDYPEAHHNLGVALAAKNDADGAIAEYRKALGTRGDFPEAYKTHCNLGSLLQARGRLDEATAACREAIRLKPDHTEAHYNLGNVLKDKGQLDGAIAAYREALRFNPDRAEHHCNLGHALQEQGKFEQALAAFRRGHELGSRDPGWRYPSAEWVRQAESAVEVEAKFSQFLSGRAQPADTADRLALARLCADKHLYVAAARFLGQAFADQPSLTDDPQKNGLRYNAACVAALAGCGQGQDAGALGDEERTRLRRQALSWLRDDLRAWGRQWDQDPDHASARVAKALRHWQGDPDFAGVRGPEALGRLPVAER